MTTAMIEAARRPSREGTREARKGEVMMYQRDGERRSVSARPPVFISRCRKTHVKRSQRTRGALAPPLSARPLVTKTVARDRAE
jgi:hypothetical protein